MRLVGTLIALAKAFCDSPRGSKNSSFNILPIIGRQHWLWEIDIKIICYLNKFAINIFMIIYCILCFVMLELYCFKYKYKRRNVYESTNYECHFCKN